MGEYLWIKQSWTANTWGFCGWSHVSKIRQLNQIPALLFLKEICPHDRLDVSCIWWLLPLYDLVTVKYEKRAVLHSAQGSSVSKRSELSWWCKGRWGWRWRWMGGWCLAEIVVASINNGRQRSDGRAAPLIYDQTERTVLPSDYKHSHKPCIKRTLAYTYVLTRANK